MRNGGMRDIGSKGKRLEKTKKVNTGLIKGLTIRTAHAEINAKKKTGEL